VPAHVDGRLTNPRVDELIEKIKVDMVTYARDAYLAEAWQIVTDDVAYLPIRHGVSVFAIRKNPDVPPDPWDVPRFRLARGSSFQVASECRLGLTTSRSRHARSSSALRPTAVE
jgi:hypothetical protein